MGLVRTVEPTALAASMQEVLAQTRISDNSEEGYIESLIKRATGFCEAYTDRQFITATWRQSCDRFPADNFFVPRPRLIAVTSLTYVDTDGATQTLVEGTNYDVDTDSEPGRVGLSFNASWPGIRDVNNAVKLTFTAGYGASDEQVPHDIKQAIMLLVAHWYEHREAATSIKSEDIKFSVEALLDLHKIPVYV